MGLLLRTLLTLALVAPVSLLASPAGHAAAQCSCFDDSAAQLIDRADLVAEVTVRDRGRTTLSGAPATQYRVSTDRVWKGPVEPRYRVTSVDAATVCGVTMRRGGSYLLLATRTGQAWTTTICNGTAAVQAQDPFVSREEVMTREGPGKVPAGEDLFVDEVVTGPTWWSLIGLALALTLVLGSSVGLVLRRRARTG